jgi:hypothetical protein
MLRAAIQPTRIATPQQIWQATNHKNGDLLLKSCKEIAQLSKVQSPYRRYCWIKKLESLVSNQQEA